MRRNFSFFGLFMLSALAGGCANLDRMQQGECGNGVVENQEDCDRFPSGQCNPPGSRFECKLGCGLRPDGSRPDCPTGWGCGTDDVCRKAQGTFEAASTVPMSYTPRLASGDLDGDGRADLVAIAERELQALYFDDKANVTKTINGWSANTVPVVGQLTSADARADLLLITDGLTVLRGRKDRTLQPTAYSPFSLESPSVRAAVLDAMPDGSDPEEPLEWIGSEILLFDDTKVSHVGIAHNGAVVDLPESIDLLAGNVQVGNLSEGDAHQNCDELVFAFEGLDWVWLYSPCAMIDGAMDWNHDPNAEQVYSPLDPIQIPDDKVVTAEPVLADVNLDGHLDVVVGVVPRIFWETTGDIPPEAVEPYVAYGLGSGDFNSTPPPPPTDPPEPVVGDHTASPLTNPTIDEFAAGTYARQPIALGDLNGDHMIDLVLPSAILISRPWIPADTFGAISYREMAFDPYADWDMAVIADFNANGIPDVVVGSTDTLGLTFYNGAGGGLFNEYRIPTTGSPGHLIAGDFDGDLILDVAFSEEGRHGDAVQEGVEMGDALSVSYGSGFGAPSAPVSMGRFSRVEQIAAGNLAQYHLDGIHDLFVVSSSEDESTGSIAVLPGSTDRQMLAPFHLSFDTGAPQPMDMTPLIAALGEFDGDDERHPDIVALGIAPLSEDLQPTDRGRDLRLWLLPSTGEAAIDPSRDIPSEPLPKGFIAPRGAMVSVDLDGDHIDEVVMLGTQLHLPSLDAKGAVLTAWTEDAGGATRFAFGDVELTDELYWQYFSDPDGRLDDPALDIVDLSTAYEDWSLGTQVVAGDVDGDELDDVIALAFTEVLPGMETTSHLVVFRNLGNGSLDVAGRMVLTDVLPDAPTAMTLMELDGDASKELVVLTWEGAYRMDVDFKDGTVKNIAALEGVGGGESLVSADFTGDGVPDIAVGTVDGVTLYRGREVHE